MDGRLVGLMAGDGGVLRGRRAAGAFCALLVLLGTVVVAPNARAATGFNSQLTRAPYLTDLVGLHVNVNWATDKSSSTGTLNWGPVTNGTCTLTSTATAARSSITVGSVAEYQWKVPLDFAGQGTYCYRPQLSGTDLLGTAASPQFQTQVAAGDSAPFTFDVFGDWGQVDANGNSVDQANLFAQVANSGARFAVTVGDNGYPSGSQINYGDLVQTGANTSAIFGPSFWTVAGSRIPLFSTVGNHGLSGSSHTDITTWTQDSAVATSGGRYQNDTYCCVNGSNSSNYGSEWYAFDAGNARFYILDSAWGDSNPGNASVYENDADAHFAPGTPQYTWLLNDLQTHPTALKFAFSHYPWYSDNPSQPSDTFLQGPDNLEGLLGRYGVNIAFNGHAHIYERNTASAPGMPITYVTGGGGATLEPIGPCHSYDAYGIGWSPTKLTGTRCGAAPAPTSASQVFHFLKVTVNGSSVTVTPTDENGRTFDSQTYNFPSKPNTVIDSGPGPLTNSTSATFTFHSTEPGATFACSLDGATSVACGSPITYNGLATGAHAFSVASTTTSGTDPTPDVRNWTIDRSPPSTPTNLTGTAVSYSRVNLSWTASTDNTGVTGYDVTRNGTLIATAGGTATSYADNTARASTTYQYSVAARDGAGNVSPSAAVSVTTPAAPPGPTFVQAAGSSTTTVTLPAPSTPGNLLVLSAGVYTGLSRPITAVTDGKNTWTKVGAYALSGQNSDGEMWYAANAASVTSITVTTSASTVALQAQEFAGVAQTAPLDGSNGGVASSTSASSGSASPTGANDLAVGFIAGHSSSQPIGVTSAGYTTQPQVTVTSPSTVSVVSGYQTLGSTSAQSFAGNFPNGMYWSAGIALFKAGSTTPPPANDFSIAAAPSSATVTRGQGTTSTISTTITSGVAQQVSLSASGAPSGTTVSFNPTTINSGQSSTMTVTTSTSTPVGGPTPITVTGTGATATRSTTFSLTVTAAPSNDFSIAASPSSVTLTAGQGTTSTISTTITSGVAQQVSLSASGAPSGTTVSFNPTTINAGQSSTMTVTTSPSTPAGTSTITVTGTGASAVHSTPFSLTVVTGSAPRLIQAMGAKETATATTLTGTFAAPSTAGNLLVLSASVYTGATNTLTSVTDSGGNTWIKIGAFFVAGHNSDGEMWYSPNAKSVTTVTVTTNSAASVAFAVQEFAGIAKVNPLDVSAGTSNTGTTAGSGSVNPGIANELVVGFVAGHGNTQPISVTSPGFTTQPQQTTTGTIATVVSGYKVLASPTAQSFSGSFSSSMYWAAGIAVFKPGS